MTKAKPLPPVETLRSLFDYNPETGDITWKTNRGCVKVGDTAGYIMPTGYKSIFHNKRMYLCHRLAWFLHYGEDPLNYQIDHINQVKDDNRIVNLRKATHSQNMLNRGREGFVKGVTQIHTGAWLVRFKSKHVSQHWSYEEAVEARLNAEKVDIDKEFLGHTQT